MSRIGKKNIEIPNNVNVLFKKNFEIDQEQITVKGKHGTIEKTFSTMNLEFIQEDKKITISRRNETKKAREYHGLARVLLQNMILGVDQLFSKTLIAEGVGYKFQLDKDTLILSVGFSHVVKFIIPNDIQVKIESPTKLILIGIDKEKVGFFTSKIRSIRPPEPYKGKGLLYEGEKIIRKVGKTGK